MLVHLRVPLIMAQAIVSPTARPPPRHPHRRPRRRHPASPPGAAPTERVDRATEALATAVEVLLPQRTGLRGRVPHAGGRAPAGGCDLDDVTMDAVLRALPHNVTTEMDLQLWALAQQVRADPASAAELGAADLDLGALATRFHSGDLPAVLQDGLAAFLRRYGHRAVAEIDLGMPRWSEEPEHVLGVLANYLRLAPPKTGTRTPHPMPGSPPASGWRSRRSRTSSPGSGGAPGGARGLVGFALGRVRALVGLREVPKDHLVRLIALARAELAAVGVELAARGLLDAPDDVFFLDLRDVRAAVAGADLRARVAARREEYARELRRRHVPRVLLSDGTEPEALARADVPDDGALVGTPASAGHGHGDRPRRPRSCRRAAGARRDPRRAVHRPRLDPAVPHRRRAGDGDGRGQLARRRRRPRVRHPGRRRRPGRHHTDHDRCRGSPSTAPRAGSTSSEGAVLQGIPEGDRHRLATRACPGVGAPSRAARRHRTGEHRTGGHRTASARSTELIVRQLPRLARPS